MVAGKSGGGNSYGYDVVKRFDEQGEPIRGDRSINKDQAAIVVRIFKDYAAGKPPRQIAHDLNAEHIPCPKGRGWGPSTINSNWRRGIGILNNELYIGRLVWNRLTYIKDPNTGKRVSRLNPEQDWIIHEVPELRIISDELWHKVKDRQQSIRHTDKGRNGLTAKRRNRTLFSGLIKCGECGGGYTIAYRDRFGCATVKNKGTCTNHLHIDRQELEERILHTLSSQLMHPDLFDDFCKAYTQETNRLRIEATGDIAHKRAELTKVERSISQIITAIEDGMYQPSMKDRMDTLEARKTELINALNHAEEPPALLHPNMAQEYKKRITNLYEALKDDQTRLEAAEDIRSLIGKITVTPSNNNTADLWLDGDLAGILSLAAGKRTPAHPEDEQVLLSMVAGARNLRKPSCGQIMLIV